MLPYVYEQDKHLGARPYQIVIFLAGRFMDNKELHFAQTKMPVKRIISIALILAIGIIIYLFLFKSPAFNYETGYITPAQRGFILTVKGKRRSMVHDLISLFEIKSYEDSIQYRIPRYKGVIKGEEIGADPGFRMPVGTITIENDEFKIHLFIYNTNNKKIEADTWNGQYKLQWRKE